MSLIIDDIFMANIGAVYVGTDLSNSLPTGSTFVKVPELASYPGYAATRNVITTTSFDTNNVRKFAGQITHPDIELKFNYIPSNASQGMLISSFDTGTRYQFKFVGSIDDAPTKSTYHILNGFVSDVQITGEKDSVVTLSVKISVDGKLIDRGIE